MIVLKATIALIVVFVVAIMNFILFRIVVSFLFIFFVHRPFKDKMQLQTEFHYQGYFTVEGLL